MSDDDILRQQLEDALNSEEVPSIYFNGFINTLGTGDVVMVLKRNDKPVAVCNASYTVIKTLAEKLGKLVADLEGSVNQSILTTDQVRTGVSEDEG